MKTTIQNVSKKFASVFLALNVHIVIWYWVWGFLKKIFCFPYPIFADHSVVTNYICRFPLKNDFRFPSLVCADHSVVPMFKKKALIKKILSKGGFCYTYLICADHSVVTSCWQVKYTLENETRKLSHFLFRLKLVLSHCTGLLHLYQPVPITRWAELPKDTSSHDLLFGEHTLHTQERGEGKMK